MSLTDPFRIDVGPRRSSIGRRLPDDSPVIDSALDGITSMATLKNQRHVWWLVGGSVLIMIALFSRMIIVQVVRGAEYRLRSDSNRVRTVVVPAPRGAILDRNGLSLAENIPNITL